MSEPKKYRIIPLKRGAPEEGAKRADVIFTQSMDPGEWKEFRDKSDEDAQRGILRVALQSPGHRISHLHGYRDVGHLQCCGDEPLGKNRVSHSKRLKSPEASFTHKARYDFFDHPHLISTS